MMSCETDEQEYECVVGDTAKHYGIRLHLHARVVNGSSGCEYLYDVPMPLAHPPTPIYDTYLISVRIGAHGKQQIILTRDQMRELSQILKQAGF